MSKESEAIKSEALHEGESTTPSVVEFEFDGHAYSFNTTEPTPKAMEYLADYIDQNNGVYALLFVRKVIGQDAWDLWCERHQADQVVDMLMAINGAFSGNS